MPSKQRREEAAQGAGRPQTHLDKAKQNLKARQQDTKRKLRELTGERPKKSDIL